MKGQRVHYNLMSEKEEEFPFEEFVEALSDEGDLKTAMRPILAAASEHNAYWTYSAISTLIQMLRSKEEDPSSKCRCLEAAALLMATQEYPVLTLMEVYMLPLLQEVALFRVRKSEEQTAVYFQQTCGLADSPQLRKDSVQFVGRAAELIFLGAASKPHRTVQVQELKQHSLFAVSAALLTDSGVPAPQWRWICEQTVKRARRDFIGGLRRFEEDSEGWAEFLLVNLLEEVRSGKKELLELRQLLAYGENYLTSPVINVCEDELSDLGENFEEKRRYLGLLNELVRCGDIEAIIMIKNSEFLPAIAARISVLQGHLGPAQGELLFPEIQASKQAKREFYCDFLRALENWAKAMPSDYDSEEFNICGIYRLLKVDKKFKFPDNLVLARYEKEAKENLTKNQERNEKLIEILEQSTSRQPSLSAPFSRSNVKQQNDGTLSAHALQVKLEEAQRDLKELMVDGPTAEAALVRLTAFKDNWIGFLQALNLEEAEEEQLEAVVSAGEKCVEQIQLIVPLGTAFAKGKLTHKEFKQRIAESLEFHLEVSRASNLPEQEKKSLSISMLKSRNSHLGKSQQGKSRIAGRQLRSRIKEKSKMRPLNPLNLSRAMDRSNISRFTDRSRADRSKYTEKSKFTERSRVQGEPDFAEKSRINQLHSQLPQEKSGGFEAGITLPKVQKSASIYKQEDSLQRGNKTEGKSFRSAEGREKGPSSNPSRVSLEEQAVQPSRVSRVRSKQPSQVQATVRVPQIQDYSDSIHPPQENQGSTRKSGSKILLRRSHSKLEQSRDSVRSGRGSVGKEQQQEGPAQQPQLGRTKKVSGIESALRGDGNGDETIELNGNIIKEGSMAQKKSEKLAKMEELDDFRDEGQRQISSIIHSSGKEFHNSAEKIFSTVKKQSELPQPSQNSNNNSHSHSHSRVAPSSIHRPSPPPMAESFKPKFPSEPQNSISQEQQQQSSSNDLIVNPDLAPMRHSFHQQSTLLSPRKLSENPQFKEVFAKRYEGIQSREKEEKLLRNNSGLKNVIKSKQKPSSHKDSLMYQITADRRLQSQRQLQSPRLHMEYGGSYQSSKDMEFQALQQRKNKEILQLREKIKQLERETLTMRTKLVAKDNELRSIKNLSAAGSERNFQFTSPAESKYDRASRSQSRSEKGSLRGSSVGKHGQASPFQREVQSGFKQYLQRIKGTTFRKSLLKQKCLIHKSDELEIGCLSQTGETLLEATLYVTPHRFDLIDFSLAVQHDSHLRVRATPEQVRAIGAKRQQKVHLTIQVLKLPFCLPELEINYKAASEYASNYHRLVLPLAFNKFCPVAPVTEPPVTHLGYLRTDDFKFNAKVAKLDRLGESFPGWSVIPPGKERGQWLVMGRCGYASSRFSVCLNLGERSSWIEGFLLEGDPVPMRFFICTYKEILDAGKK